MLKGKVTCINFLLNIICLESGYILVDNSNIVIRDLSKDGIHLLQSGRIKLAENSYWLESGKTKLADNFYWLSPYDYYLEAHTHGNIEHTYSQLLNTKNCEWISSKSILNKNTSNEANNTNNVLQNVRLKNSNEVIIGHISINSLRNKFELHTEMVWDKFDLLMISKTKLDSILHEILLKTMQTWQE